MEDSYSDGYGEIPVTPPLRRAGSADRYPATRFLVSLIRIIGVATLTFGAVGALVVALLGELSWGYTILALLAAFIYFVICFASAEGLKVIVDMEAHQRAILALLESRVTHTDS